MHINSHLRYLRKVCLSACMCVLTACASGGVKFNEDIFHQGGLIIAGISAVDSPLSEQQRLQYADLIKQAIKVYHPNLTLVDSATVYRSVGRSMYGQIQDSYRFSGSASFALMDVMRARFPRSRYVMYARIEREQIDQRYQPLEKQQGYDLLSSRIVMVSMRIYDLESRQTQVWAAGLQDVGSSKRRMFGNYTEETLRDLYPEPPANKEILQKIIDNLVQSIGK